MQHFVRLHPPHTVAVQQPVELLARQCHDRIIDTAALAVRRSEWEPISQSHQGQRHEPRQKSGCTGAIYPSNHHEPFAWQTGGVHVRTFEPEGVTRRISNLADLLAVEIPSVTLETPDLPPDLPQVSA